MDDGLQISVLICTWNRAYGLDTMLRALAEQSLSSKAFEVLIVDNNSTDSTRKVVRNVAAKMPFDLRYLFETRPGKCWALNAGIESAKADFVLCMDDDCTPDGNWLETVLKSFDDPDVGIVGGSALSVFPKSVQQDSNRLFLANRFFGDFAPYDSWTEIFDKNPPLGMNLAFRKTLCDKIGGFDVALGPRPGRHIGREETAFIRRAQQAGYRVFYNPKAVVYHHIQEERVCWPAIRKQAYFSGVGICREKYLGDGGASLARKLELSLVFCLELAYSSLRTGLYFCLPKKRIAAKFRLAAAQGKMAELWTTED